MEDLVIIIHGSENSLDRDAYIVVPEEMNNQDSKELCSQYKELNANLIKVVDGNVVWSYKGTKDECNNSIMKTYHLHKQDFENPITSLVERDSGIKMLRTIRGILSYCSRTQWRVDVKKALSSSSLDVKMAALKSINLMEVDDFQKNTKIEAYKYLAFQMGQTLALIKDGIELFTKNQVINYYPELTDYLNRTPADAKKLTDFYNRFVKYLDNSYQKVNDKDLYMVQFHGQKQILDAKKEVSLPPVVIFDVDGTLMDETHRKKYRDNKEWEKYFSLCDLDNPIQPIIDLTKEYRAKGYEIWVMTGRSNSVKDKTVDSLKKAGVEFDHIKMRGENVFIPDYILKPAWVAKYIGIERVESIYDDRDIVIEGFKKKGLKAINVNDILNKKNFKP